MSSWCRVIFLFLVLSPFACHAGEAEEAMPEGVLSIVPLGEDAEAPDIRNITYPGWFEETSGDLRHDLSEALKKERQGLLLYFGQSHCTYCDLMLKENFKRDDVVAYAQKYFKVMAFDIWGPLEFTDLSGQEVTEEQFAAMLGIQMTPTLLFFDNKGREALRLRGYYPPYIIRAALDFVSSGQYHFESFRGYVGEAKTSEQVALNSHPLFIKPPYNLDRSHYLAERPLVVLFEQRNCHACELFHEEILASSEIQRLLGQMEVAQLDMWSDTPVITPDGSRLTARQWADYLELFYTPTLLIFDRQGDIVAQVDSMLKLAHLHALLEYALEPVHNAVKLDRLLRNLGCLPTQLGQGDDQD